MTANIRTQFRFQLKDQGVNNVLNALADNNINLQSHSIVRIKDCNIVKITVGPDTEDPTVVQETRCILNELCVEFTETSVVEIEYACGISGQFAIFYTIFTCAKLVPLTVTSSTNNTVVYQFDNTEVTNAALAKANATLTIMRENPKNPELALVNAGLLCDGDDSACEDDGKHKSKKKGKKYQVNADDGACDDDDEKHKSKKKDKKSHKKSYKQ